MSEPRLRAIVFDFDGVVLESADVKTEAFVELFAPHGPELAAKVRAHHLAHLGISRFKKFEWIYANLLGKAITDDESRALGEAFSALSLEKILVAPFVPGADAALEALAARWPLFVASGTPQVELRHIVERRGLTPRFREVHGTPAEKPAILDGLMARHGWTRDQVLFIGDGASDHKAAAATGVEFLARTTPALHDHWTALGVRMVPDLTSLPRLVEAW
jgi:phosphoglycolate phosphatase-like HAD superfamily hydrolase